MQLTLPLIWENATISVNTAPVRLHPIVEAPAGLRRLFEAPLILAGGAAITMAGDNVAKVTPSARKLAALLTVLQEDVSSSTVIFVLLAPPLPAVRYRSRTVRLSSIYDGQLAMGRGVVHHQRYGGHRRYLCTNERATRNMTSSSTLTDLTLNSGATINFSHEDGEPWQKRSPSMKIM